MHKIFLHYNLQLTMPVQTILTNLINITIVSFFFLSIKAVRAIINTGRSVLIEYWPPSSSSREYIFNFIFALAKLDSSVKVQIT